MKNQDLKAAGFSDDNDGRLEQPEAQSPLIRLSEVRQLIVPITAELPDELSGITFHAKDLVELGHVIYEAEVKEIKVCILCLSTDAAAVATQYPTLFRLSYAVLRGVPHCEYQPRFDQAMYGANEITWPYLVDALGLDDSLKFDIDIGKNTTSSHRGDPTEEDEASADAAPGSDA